MNYQILIILATSFLMLFAIAELVYRIFNVKSEYTRKFVHVSTGVLSMFFPIFLNSHWEVLFLCGSFALILLLSFRFNFLRSVNDINRRSYGSLCYPLAVYCAYLVFSFVKARGTSTLNPLLFFYLPILIMAFCDPVAALVGRKKPIKSFKVGRGRKSIAGSGSFFLIAVFLSIGLMSFFQDEFSDTLVLATAALTAGTTMLAEAFSPSGTDNFTIPVTAIASLALINFYFFVQ